MPEKRDWLDYVGLAILPAAAFGFGLFTYLHDGVMETMKTQAGYVDDLGDANPAKQDIALLELTSLAESKTLDASVWTMVEALAKGDLKNQMNLNAYNLVVKYDPNNPFLTPGVQPDLALLGTTVYIQVPTEAQLAEGKDLLNVLQNDGALAPGIEIVGPRSPLKTQVRYFAKAMLANAQFVNVVLKTCGFSAVKPLLFSNYPSAGKQIEVWISASDTPDSTTLASCGQS